jgi:hypothetical protein
MKKKTLTKEEHEAIGDSIRKASIDFNRHYSLIMKTYGVTSKEYKLIHKFLHVLTCKLCNELDKRWYNEIYYNDEEEEIATDKDNPYYGKGKIGYS